MMTFADALVKAGVVAPGDTPDAKRKQRQKQEQSAYREAVEFRKASGAGEGFIPEPGLKADDYRIVAKIVPPEIRLAEDGGRGEDDGEENGGPPRVRGEMVWLHKTAPVLVIQGRKGLSPEEMAAGRRR
jgi:hypothetical protein